MYPVPPAKETQGLTDRYIGSWLKTGRVKREDVVIATKVGPPLLGVGGGRRRLRALGNGSKSGTSRWPFQSSQLTPCLAPPPCL